VLSEASGSVGIDVPRDRAGTFEPQIVKKRQRRLSGVDQIVLSLYAKGLTTGEISAHFAEIYDASVSKQTISRITDRVLEEMNDWAARPLDEIYAAIFIDAIVVKVRDGQVDNRPIYAAIGVSLDGERDILGLWSGAGGEGAKFWMSVLTDLKNRGVRDSFFVVCNGLRACLHGPIGQVVLPRARAVVAVDRVHGMKVRIPHRHHVVRVGRATVGNWWTFGAGHTRDSDRQRSGRARSKPGNVGLPKAGARR
jgi:hypothetical protein